ncbi:hypothetical protein ACS0TY_029059 [Phlomoides rotata]
MGERRLNLFSDSTKLIHAIKNGNELRNSAGLVLEEILKELSEILKWDVAHIPRDVNRAAHGAAKNSSLSPVGSSRLV